MSRSEIVLLEGITVDDSEGPGQLGNLAKTCQHEDGGLLCVWVFGYPNLNNPYVINRHGVTAMLHSPSTLNVSLTEKAAEKVKAAIEKDGKAGAALRLYVSGGGCSGFQYGLAFDEQADGDHVIEAHGVKLLIDEQSAEYLDGSEVDYVETVMGEGFRVNNPNATETCGCGHSFKPK